MKKLQKILNRAARIIKGIAPRERITPSLIDLHWLPIKARIEFKLCVLAHQAITTGCPRYLRTSLRRMQPADGVITRSVENGVTLFISGFESQYGFRAFKHAAPRLYNSLPVDLRRLERIDLFKNSLKTYLFSKSYNMNDRTVNDEYAV